MTSLTEVDSSGSFEMHNVQSKKETQRVTALQGRAMEHLNRMDWAIRVFAVIAIVAFVATIVLLGLAQAEYVHPLTALYAFSGCIAALIVIKCIDCCQQAVGKKVGIDLQKDYYPVRQPMPDRSDEKIDDKGKNKK